MIERFPKTPLKKWWSATATLRVTCCIVSFRRRFIASVDFSQRFAPLPETTGCLISVVAQAQLLKCLPPQGFV